ncbi:hypothetical protein HYV82_01260 [Candidatus Woesearchaeota archaeon]|nr:hypothetical protein [Candidatus Woesearchaeota archaeon]
MSQPVHRTGGSYQRVPFNVEELRGMVGLELYLHVYGTLDKQELIAHGRKSEDGLLGQVTSRSQYLLMFDLFNEGLAELVLADGTPLSERIGNDVVQVYIFTAETVQIEPDKPPVLTGYARPLNSHHNTLDEPLEVTVRMAGIPTEKSSMTLMRL